MDFTKFSRSKEEIARQIALLEQERASLPEFSKFGDNNWSPIDAAVDVLQGGDPEYYVEEDSDTYNRALDAKDWLDGASDNDLVEV